MRDREQTPAAPKAAYLTELAKFMEVFLNITVWREFTSQMPHKEGRDACGAMLNARPEPNKKNIVSQWVHMTFINFHPFSLNSLQRLCV